MWEWCVGPWRGRQQILEPLLDQMWVCPQPGQEEKGVGEGGSLAAGVPVPWRQSNSPPLLLPASASSQHYPTTAPLTASQPGGPLATCQLLCTHLPKGIP